MTETIPTPATVETGNEYLFVRQNGAHFVDSAADLYDGGVLAANGEWIDSNAVFEIDQLENVKRAISNVVNKVMEVELAEADAAEKAVATKPAQSINKAAKKPSPSTPPKAAKRNGETKADIAMKIFRQMGDVNASRKDVIAQFVDELGMTEAGASTYHYNCKKRFLAEANQ